MEHTYKLTLAYDGTNYCGFQVQPQGATIQNALQKALSLLYKKPIIVTGSGRTDSNVHALGQVVHFRSERPLSLRALQGALPSDITPLRLERAEDNFHARIHAKKKRYHYYLTKHPNPFLHLYSTLERNLNVDLIRQAATKFEGTKDFTSFANVAKDASKNKIRTIYSIEIQDFGSLVEIAFTGSGFLYKQVRNIVGAFIHLSRKKIELHDIDTIFEQKDRTKAPPTAKGKGLFLMEVSYDKTFELIEENESKCQAPFFLASSMAK